MSDAAPEGSGTSLARDAAPGRSTVVLDISNAFVRLMKESYGKGPTSVKTHLLGDTIVVVTKGGFTQVEHTLNDLGHESAVLDQRRIFQEAMQERFKEVVAEATGREVLALLSATHVDPDIQCETFILVPERDAAGA
jgi:uncharacterized protein YbcI